MIYDFVAKIKNIQNKDVLNDETLQEIVSKINVTYDSKLEFRFILPNQDDASEFLVKGKSSISSMPALHDKELDIAIAAFTAYIEELERIVAGQISRSDAFYNNTQSFKKLFT